MATIEVRDIGPCPECGARFAAEREIQDLNMQLARLGREYDIINGPSQYAARERHEKLGKRNAELIATLVGARDTFREIQAETGKCGCEPGDMCTMCICREAADAMESALRGDTIPTADSPEDTELARKAFGDGTG